MGRVRLKSGDCRSSKGSQRRNLQEWREALEETLSSAPHCYSDLGSFCFLVWTVTLKNVLLASDPPGILG